MGVMNLALLCATVQASAISIQSEDGGCNDKYLFAEHLMLKSDYFRAITEFERYLYYCPDGNLIYSAKENIGRSLLLAEQYALVFDWYLGLKEEERFRDKFALINATALFRTEQYSETIELLELTDLHELGHGEKAYSFYIKGLSFVHLEQWDNAKEYFMHVPSDSPFKNKADKYANILMNSTSYPQKSPKIAGLLSIIPGLGYAHVGHYQTAIASFVVNSLLFWVAYDSFIDDKEAQGITISIFSAGFYIGNITGSIQSTARFNKYEYKQYHDMFIE